MSYRTDKIEERIIAARRTQWMGFVEPLLNSDLPDLLEVVKAVDAAYQENGQCFLCWNPKGEGHYKECPMKPFVQEVEADGLPAPSVT